MQFYTNIKKEYTASLPNAQVFKVTEKVAKELGNDFEAGWYYWYCFPGCLPDSEMIGPYESCLAAIKAARSEDVE